MKSARRTHAVEKPLEWAWVLSLLLACVAHEATEEDDFQYLQRHTGLEKGLWVAEEHEGGGLPRQ